MKNSRKLFCDAPNEKSDEYKCHMCDGIIGGERS